MKLFKNLRTSSTTNQSWMQKHSKEAVYQLDNQMQNILEELAPLITKKDQNTKNMI